KKHHITLTRPKTHHNTQNPSQIIPFNHHQNPNYTSSHQPPTIYNTPTLPSTISNPTTTPQPNQPTTKPTNSFPP
ncbi:hypothetical protein, partial [Bacillus sp. WP8]|uniref:hypothetical protein n=1 Tax=Bacillus sp. WP8 TaxID=756828 RepID=UPI001C930624